MTWLKNQFKNIEVSPTLAAEGMGLGAPQNVA